MKLRVRYSIIFLSAVIIGVAVIGATHFFLLGGAISQVLTLSTQAVSSAVVKSTEDRARSLVQTMADGLINPIALLRVDEIVNIGVAFKSQNQITHLVVYGSDRMILFDGTDVNAAYGAPAPAEIRDRLSATMGTESGLEGDSVRMISRIVLAGKTLGWIDLGLSLASAKESARVLEAGIWRIHSEILNDAVLAMVGLGVILSILGLIVAYMLARRLTRPIEALSVMASQIAAGVVPSGLGSTRRDEIGKLADDLMQTSRELQATTVLKSYLDNIIESLEEGLIVINRDGRISMVNTATVRLLQTDAAALIDRRIGEVVPLDSPQSKDIVEHAANAASGAEAAKNPDRTRDLRFKLPNGQEIMVQVSFADLRDGVGRQAGKIVVLVDVSDRYAYIEALEESKRTAEEANGAKSTFLATMSHELRTPMNAILGFSEVLEKQMFGPLGNRRYVEYAGDIHSSGKHLLGLINSVLDLSKIEAGKMELKEEFLDLDSAVVDTVQSLREMALKSGLTLTVDTATAGYSLFADRMMVRQMLLNMLSNAIKFTPAGGKIAVKLGRDGNAGLSVTVEDTGIGIKEEDLDRVMRPFEQVADPYSRHHQGTGLGLPLVKAQIELHGGRLTLKSRVGEGTQVSIVFPANRVRDANTLRVAV